MSTTIDDAASLPVYPGARSARCPFDPSADQAGWNRDEAPQLARLWNGLPVWVVSRYDDVRTYLADPRLSADSMRFPKLNPGVGNATRPNFPRMDDPEHARLRLMLTGEFTVKRVATMRPELERMVERFLDDMIAKGQPADLVENYALPLPSLVISMLLGVPYEDNELFQNASAIINRAGASAEEKAGAAKVLFDYAHGLAERKKLQPGDDLISRLIVNRVATGELTEADVATAAVILLFAGHETTANMIGLATAALLENPRKAAQLRDAEDPAEIAAAVEELLRYLSITQDMISRVASEDLTIGGRLVRAGDLVTFNLPVANRDQSFLSDADELDLGRNPRGHLAFGYGVHQCLGQNLARLELQIALPALLRRLPNLRLAIPIEEVRFRDDMSVYGVYELPVLW